MQNDIFKGKIQRQYYGFVKFCIIFANVLFFVIGIFLLLIALFYKKVEPAARIFLYVLSSLSILSSILYPILIIFAIKTYPKHKKFAYSVLKEFVFETTETKIINNYKE